MIVSLVIVVGICVVVALLSKQSDQEPTAEQQRAWDTARRDERSTVGRALLNVAKPMSRSALLQNEARSPAYRMLEKKLVATGSFGGNVEVFLSAQVAATLIGAIIIALGAGAAGGDTLILMISALAGIAVPLLPYNNVAKAAKRRETAIMENLPDFAELLQMPLTSGMGVLPALDFTAKRIPGPVADEVQRMLSYIAANPTHEADAFIFAGERLGSVEAKGFFSALLQAQMEGSRVSAALERQAAQLRKKSYERQRAVAKRLPIKLVLIMGLHFLPMLFILTLLPVFVSFGNL